MCKEIYFLNGRKEKLWEILPYGEEIPPCVQIEAALRSPSQWPEEIHLTGSNLELREMRLRDMNQPVQGHRTKIQTSGSKEWRDWIHNIEFHGLNKYKDRTTHRLLIEFDHCWSPLVARWVKGPALSLQWLGSLLWQGLDPWAGNFWMPWVQPKKKKK